MRALLLAAGLGSRLNEVTTTTPKCLVKVGTETMLDHWLNKLHRLGVSKFVINTHHLRDQVDEFINHHILKDRILVSHEPKLLGTAGTIEKHANFLSQEMSFIVHVDNFCADNLESFLTSHQQRNNGTTISMLTFNTKSPQTSGIVEKDQNDRLIQLYEKQRKPPPGAANAAVFLTSPDFYTALNGMNLTGRDFSADVIPGLCEHFNCVHTDMFYIDIGTKISLLQANEWRKTNISENFFRQEE